MVWLANNQIACLKCKQAIIRRNSVEQFLQHLNKQDKNIVFTVEVEKVGSLPFLDVRLQRTDEGSIKTGVYRKPTYSGRVLAFESHHPVNAKAATVKALMDRVQTHYSEDDLWGKEEERAQIMCDLRNNGYKDKFIAKLGKQRVKRTNRDDVNRISVPYVRGVSEPIKRVLAPLGIELCHKTEPWQ